MSDTTWVSGRTQRRSRATVRASRRTVLVALISNAIVAVSKLAGGVLSGSAALLAEAAHSLADTTNQGFLLVSISLAERPPTPEQPFGYGRLRFLWTFVAAITMFIAGAVFAIGWGVYELLAGGRSGAAVFAYVTLAIDFAAEGASWLRAVRQTRHDAAEAQMPLLRYIRASRDPNVTMVLFEDTAALVGLALAAAGIVLAELTGHRAFDAGASIAIGGLLVVVAGLLSHDTSELLVGASARPAERTALRDVLEHDEHVDTVIELLTMVLGPNSLMVAARVDFAAGLDHAQIEQASTEIDRAMRAAVPDVTEVFLDATTKGRGGVSRE